MNLESRVKKDVYTLIEYTQQSNDTGKIGKYILKDYQLFTSRYFVNTEYLRSMLMLWDTGFGKTITALYIAREIIHKYPRMHIILLVKSSLLNTPWKSTMESECPELIDKIRILTFDHNKFFPMLKSLVSGFDWMYDRVTFIVDESHKFISRHLGKPVLDFIHDVLFDISPVKTYTSRILLLSATPFVNTSDEVRQMFKITRPSLAAKRFAYSGDVMINRKEFRQWLYGLSSVKLHSIGLGSESMNANDMFAAKRVYVHRIPLSEYQSKMIEEAADLDKMYNIESLATFQRITTNIAYQYIRQGKGLSKEEAEENLKNHISTFLSEKKTDALLKRCSNKYYQTCVSIQKTNGKCLVYLSFVTFAGLAAFVEYLKFFKIKYGVFNKDDLSSFDTFNSPENIDGQLIKTFVITNKGMEGISFIGVNDFFIIDIPWNNANLRQLIGRAIRMYSHKGHPRYYVNVHLMIGYSTEDGKTITDNSWSIDVYMYRLLIKKEKLITDFYHLFRETSLESIYAMNPEDMLEGDINKMVMIDQEMGGIEPEDVTVVAPRQLRDCLVKFESTGEIRSLQYDAETLIIYAGMYPIGKLSLDTFELDMSIPENPKIIYQGQYI